MRPAHATRPGRALLAATSILTLALALALDAPASAGSGAVGQFPHARTADACAGSVSLGLSDRRPRQLRPVRFSAAGSSVPAGMVVFYDFDYGDGSDDATAQPTAVHAYQEPGTYQAKLSVVTACNTILSSSEYQVVVRDGLPPTVAITFPRANQLAHFGPSGILLTGTARDPSGVRRVELALALLSVRRSGTRAAAHAAKATPGPGGAGCYWYDGQRNLRLRGCAAPLFFPASLRGSRWSFRMSPRSQIPPGVYAVRVRATDRVGNTDTVFSPSLHNILAFNLVA